MLLAQQLSSLQGGRLNGLQGRHPVAHHISKLARIEAVRKNPHPYSVACHSGETLLSQKAPSMDQLKALRANPELLDEFEKSWVSPTTIEQRVAQFAEMRQVFRQHLEDTEEISGPERRQALLELQRRLGYPV